MPPAYPPLPALPLPPPDVPRHGEVVRRWAVAAGAAAVLLALSGFAIWSSMAGNALSTQAMASTRLAAAYAAASESVTALESLERKYRLEPGTGVRARFGEADVAFVAALRRIAESAGAEDKALVDRVLAARGPYLLAVYRLFAAVDQGELAAVLRIDAGEVDPLFEVIERETRGAALRHNGEAQAALAALQDRETINARATPAVFVAGLVLLLVLAMGLRRTRVQLDNHREQAAHEAQHDALTGLPNRTLFRERFETALRETRKEAPSVALLMIDLDRFKDVNDTLGHEYGDRLLVQVGRRLAATAGTADTVARLGGDEFGVLLPRVPGIHAALDAAHRLRATLEIPFVLDDVEIDIEASVGVALSGVHGTDPSKLLQRVGVAVDAAKRNGLGWCAYSPDLDSEAAIRLALLGQLRRGIERDELFLEYQPKVMLRLGESAGVEALLRWRHPEHGLVQPAEFVPFAEHTGLIGPLTHSVLEMALTQQRAWRDAGHAVPVAVNISARNLLDETLPERISALMARYGTTAELLTLEITESAIMADPQRARQLLARLHVLGVRISLDDFGAGYTSLTELRDLPISELKIDRSFLRAFEAGGKNRMIVRSIIELGHNLGMRIVAEGVEDAGTASILSGFGCDIAQGFHLCRPAPAKDIEAWLARHDTRRSTGASLTIVPGGRT